MADSILKLKVDSSEYDSKIKRASQGILALERNLREAGETFLSTWKDEQEFIKGLGQMETVSKNARGQVSELTSAFTDLSMVYKRMSDEEKNSAPGRYLKSSLEELKTRISETKSNLADINSEINGGGGLTGALDQLAGKFGMNIQQLAGWGAAVGAAKVAIDVTKDAFRQSESNIDEWGRTVKSAEGAYDVFLNTLNNGNWSNFFSNLSTAIQGSRDLYDALDRLGSIKSNNQAAIALLQAEIQKLRLLQQQGQNVDDQIKAATQRLAYLQSQGVNAGKAAGQKSMLEVIRNDVNSRVGAQVPESSINAAIEGILRNGQSEFDKYAETVRKYENWSKAQTTYKSNQTTSTGATITTSYTGFDINKLTAEQQRQYKLAKAITEAETRIQEGISIYAQAVQEGASSAKEEFKGNRYALVGSGKSGGGGGEKIITAKELGPLQKVQNEISKLTEEALTADDARLEVIKKEIAALNEQAKVYKGIQDYVNGVEPNFKVTVGDRKAFESEQMRRFEAEFGKPVKKENQKEQKKETSIWESSIHDTQKVVSGLQSVSSGLQQMGIKLPEGVQDVLNGIQGAMSIIQGVMSIIEVFSTSTVTAQITATTANTAMMGALTAAIGANTAALGVNSATSLIPFARGGVVHAAGGFMVPGNRYSGDNIPALLDSGEVVLNRAQAGVIASDLQGIGHQQGGVGTPYVSGEQIFLATNNYLRRSGRGELLTARR